MKTLQVGDLAPQFTLLNQDNQPISLSDFKGKKVLVYFYPKALTPGCTTQACGLRDAKSELEKLGVIILGISTDAPKKLAQFVEKKALNFTLLSDEDHQVAEQFGVWGEKKLYGRKASHVMKTDIRELNNGIDPKRHLTDLPNSPFFHLVGLNQID